MNRRFEIVTEAQWEKSAAIVSRHEDIEQVLSYLAEERGDAVRIPAGRRPEAKRHVLLEYARRRKMKIQTLIPRDGWIYVRLWRENTVRKGPRRFELALPADFVEKGKPA